ncbi:MAG: C25 family cysteine peptidase [Planctomycetota bacterium]
MRKYVRFYGAIAVLLSVAALPLAGVAAAQDSQVSAPVLAGPYAIEGGPQGDQIIMEGFGRNLVPGMPDLPAKIFSVAIPPGARVTGLTFDASSGVILPGRYAVPPVGLPRVIGEEKADVYARDLATYEANRARVYGSDAPYPPAPGELVRASGYRKYNLVDVRVSPFVYHPKSGRLVYHSKVAINVHYEVPDPPADGVVLRDDLPRTERVAREIVLNYDEAQQWYSRDRSIGRGLYDFVIITLSSLTTAVQPLVDWEIAKGRTVQVVTTDWIASTYTGYDLAEKMRNFLREKYPSDQWGIEDVCLVGDYDQVPIRRTYQDVGYGQPETDYYYAELSLPDNQSWDKDGDRRWGEDSDPIDFYNEVNVGRVPWSNAATVQHICEKSVAYEENNDVSFKKNILLLGAFFWPDTDNAVLMEYKVNASRHPWMADWTMTRLYEQSYSSYPCDYDLRWTNVRNVWSAGKYAFVDWAGHGSPTSAHIYYSTGEAFADTSTCPYLNDNYPSIIFADSCSNSDTDYQNIGQEMLRQGGVGFLGATKVAFGMPGWNDPTDGSSQSFDYYFTTCVTSGDYTQGAGHQWSLRKMYTDGLWYYVKYEMFEWGALWGNPDLSLGAAPPLVLNLPEGVPSGHQPPGLANTMKVEIRDGLEHYVDGSGLLHYRFSPGDSYSTVPVTPLGGDLYEVTLPNTRPGDAPEFYFSAQGDGGSTVTSPYDAPAHVYAFDVYFVNLLLSDDFEVDRGWTVQSSDLTTGEWQRVDPTATDAQPGDDHTPAGTRCYVTDGRGGSVGDYDVDGGPTRLISPDIDLSSGDASVSFYMWFYHTGYGTQQPGEIHVSGNSGGSWTKVMNVTHAPSWSLYSFDVADYITPTAQTRVRFSVSDNPNDDIVESAVDDVAVEQHVVEASLWADAYTISAATGAAVHLSLDAGAASAGRTYVVLGSVTGTSPGWSLPGGQHMPLNWDVFTNIVVSHLNSPIFQDFMRPLDESGQAVATFDTQGPCDPVVVGQSLYFAYLLTYPPAFDFTSNPIEVTFEP